MDMGGVGRQMRIFPNSTRTAQEEGENLVDDLVKDMLDFDPQAVSSKRYRCKKCGYIGKQSTNHYGPTWSSGHFNTCPKCPPHAKYPEFGGGTLWECLDKPPKWYVPPKGQ